MKLKVYDREPMILWSENIPYIIPLEHQYFEIKPINNKMACHWRKRIEGNYNEMEYIRTSDKILFREFDEEQVAHYYLLKVLLNL